MRPEAASVFWPPNVPAGVNYGLLALATTTIVGISVVVAGGLAFEHVRACGARYVVLAGLLVIALGPTVLGVLMLREWNRVGAGFRIGAAILVALGLAGMSAMVNAMLHAGGC